MAVNSYFARSLVIGNGTLNLVSAGATGTANTFTMKNRGPQAITSQPGDEDAVYGFVLPAGDEIQFTYTTPAGGSWTVLDQNSGEGAVVDICQTYDDGS